MASTNVSLSLRGFIIVVRLFCVVPLLTGIVDMLGGIWIIELAGGVLSEELRGDPVLNNQIAFWGAIWFGFGLCLWWISCDPIGRASVARLLFAVLFLSGLARVYALVRWGFPGPVMAGAMAVELTLSPALLAWISQLQRRQGSAFIPHNERS